jgi:prepilin-type N-terminal cleavage/methylation domain-containing protein
LKTRAPELRRRRSTSGFTLIEVMLALAILGTCAVVILDQRVDVVREAASARDMRSAWMLASRKIGELELDKTLWRGTGGASNGDFSELGSDYAAFTWEYAAAREPVETQEPALRKPGEKPKEIFRLVLAVRAPGTETPVVIEALVPVAEEKPPGPEEKPEGATPEDGKPETPPAPAPPAGGTPK